MPKNVALFTLQTFSSTGGIQKMARTLAYALDSLAQKKGSKFLLASLYDTPKNLMTDYIPNTCFRGFSNRRIKFLVSSLFVINKPGIIILSHINLALIGLLIKLIRPKCQVWVFAHGIEVWRPLAFHKRRMLKKSDKVICVSNFTREQVLKRHNVTPEKCIVLNNALDPSMALPAVFGKPQYLLDRYHLTARQPVIFTLSRLASTELYKGHDNVIKAVAQLRAAFPDIKYILAGPYDAAEKVRVKKLIDQYNLSDHVILTGFIRETELPDHFLLADAFVLPSKKEGFGLVFIEASACGLPVICGNMDGSRDAILDGELGAAIDPDDIDELRDAIVTYLTQPLTAARRKQLQEICISNFNTNEYIAKLEKMIDE